MNWTEKVKVPRPTVMVIDDKFEELREYTEELFRRGFDVIAVHVPMSEGVCYKKLPHDIPLHEAWAVRDVLRLARELKPNCVLSDWQLGWDNAGGDDLLNELRFELPGVPLALHSYKFDEREHADGYDCFGKGRGLQDIAAYFDEQLGPKGRSPA